MDRLTASERLVLTLLLATVALVAAWRYWRVHTITHSPVPADAWAESVAQ